MCRSRSSVAHIETFIMGLMRDAEYIRETGFTEYGQTPGNRGAWMLRRDEGERTEFITLSLWESEDAIRAFAGDDIEAPAPRPKRATDLIRAKPTVSDTSAMPAAHTRRGSRPPSDCALRAIPP